MIRLQSKTQNLKLSQKVLFSNWDKYRGKHVLVVGEKIYSAKTGDKALGLLKKIEAKDPSVSPLLAYIPKSDALILGS